ncbi:MAG TPA: porin family protein [Puia sp.]|uniref:porin family protein n=1 Tax=Puia sp. TaxID=2045100 RepID=UPI002D1D1607|nr:porin family protein [Puia sp.]HVU93615.1 porin family protein [Puia sp.]
MRPKATPTSLLILLLLPVLGLAQNDSTQRPAAPKKEHHIIGIGFRGGLNFANVTHASDINGSTHTGFHAGIFLSPPAKIIGSYTELTFSRQGYDYNTSQVNNALMLDYISLAQLMAINITKYVQIQFGFRTAYLLNAKTDSSSQIAIPDSLGLGTQYKSLLSYYNRFDYGFTGGIEVHPVAGLIIGARYNLSLNGLYKDAFTTGGSGGISINPKNNVIQLFTGWRF